MNAVAEYLYAANRKIRIAAYHHECLIAVLEESEPHEQSPIPVQANFEGVLESAVSATDKLGEAIGIGNRLGKLSWPPLDSALGRAPDDAPVDDLRDWNSQLFWRYVRAVRKKAVHHFYDKASERGEYVVQYIGHDYERKLHGYSLPIQELTADVLEHLNHLCELINMLVERYRVENEWQQHVDAERY